MARSILTVDEEKMNSKLFLEYLPFLRQPTCKLAKKGFGDDYADIEKLRTTPIQRGRKIDLGNAPESLKGLFDEYSLKNVELLSTFFWSEPVLLEQGWGFADMSEVNIVMAPSGRIEAYQAHPVRGMPGATDCLGVLAIDLESYLESIFYAQFNKIHFISGFPDEDPVLHQKTVLVAKCCALMAGGEEYYPIWSGMLACLRNQSDARAAAEDCQHHSNPRRHWLKARRSEAKNGPSRRCPRRLGAKMGRRCWRSRGRVVDIEPNSVAFIVVLRNLLKALGCSRRSIFN